MSRGFGTFVDEHGNLDDGAFWAEILRDPTLAWTSPLRTAPIRTAGARVAYSEDQPRDDHGRWTDGGGGSTGGGDDVRETLDHARSLTDVRERSAYYKSLDPDLIRRMADAPNTVRARLDGTDEILGPRVPGEPFAARAMEAVEAGLISDRAADSIATHVDTFRSLLDENGVDPDTAEELSSRVFTALVTQENEALGRTVGDHGERHLTGDVEMATEIMRADPDYDFTARDEALLTIAGAFHDTGYITPPGNLAAFDRDHPAWSREFYDAEIAPLVESAFDADAARMVGETISTHADTDMDWQTAPFESAFRLADNLALFQAEKLPGLATEVPANLGVLVDLGRGTIDLPEAQTLMRENITAAGLNAGLTERLNTAVDEMLPSLPQFTLGMVGARIEEIGWAEDHPVITVDRTDANVALSQVIDGGQAQFDKLAKTYGVDPAEFREDNAFILADSDIDPVTGEVVQGTVALEVHVVGQPLTAALAALAAARRAYSPDQPRDELGRWVSDGGGGSEAEAEGREPAGLTSVQPDRRMTDLSATETTIRERTSLSEEAISDVMSRIGPGRVDTKATGFFGSDEPVDDVSQKIVDDLGGLFAGDVVFDRTGTTEFDTEAVLAERGEFYNANMTVGGGGVDQMCHWNAAMQWAEDPERYDLVTGVATLGLDRDGGMVWAPHTWVVDTETGTMIETNSPEGDDAFHYTAYYGARLTDDEAVDFMVWLAEPMMAADASESRWEEAGQSLSRYNEQFLSLREQVAA